MTRPELPGPEPDWPVPAGAKRLVCSGCKHWFASTGAHTCPTCIAKKAAPGKGHRASYLPEPASLPFGGRHGGHA